MEVVTRLYSKLKQHQITINFAWRVGKLVHHTLPTHTTKFLRKTEYDKQLKFSANQAQYVSGINTHLDTVIPPINPVPIQEISNPVLTGNDVTDFGSVDFVADPFLLPTAAGWHMFFEVFNYDRTPDAAIGRAWSKDGVEWEYKGIVLETDKHLSFPYTLHHEGTYFLKPETGGDTSCEVELYKASDFPTTWTHCQTLLSNDHQTDDEVLFYWQGYWWLLVGDASIDGSYLYYSTELESNKWKSHQMNPIIHDRPKAYRPAGRPIVYDDKIIMFFQDCTIKYGEKVRAYSWKALTPDTFEESELPWSPILTGSQSKIGWNSGRMHHIDAWLVDDYWLCAVDGNVSNEKLFTNDHWSIGIYSAPAKVDASFDSSIHP